MHALIEADGLSKRFGKVQALSELNLTLPPGQPVAILGPNGAGQDHVHPHGGHAAATRPRHPDRRRPRRGHASR